MNKEMNSKEEYFNNKKDLSEIEKQIEDTMKNMKRNSFVIPINPDDKEENNKNNEEENNTEKTVEMIEKFDMKPKQVKQYLDRFVIKQEEAKIALSVAVCDHYNRIKRQVRNKDENAINSEYSKQNIVLMGPTGVGKTYLIKCLANLIGVPFVKADATKYSSTGYVGGNVEDLVRDLVKLSDGSIDLAQYGIIYIDEIDKIASSASEDSRDVSGRGVQTNLLKLMEDSEVSMIGQADMIGQFESVINIARGKKKKKNKISTKNILFIVSGAFDRLSNIIRERIDNNLKIGFESKEDNNRFGPEFNYLIENSTADFIKYGFEPEFIGRLPIRIVCNELKSNDLELILKNSEGSILKQYVLDFDGYDIKFNTTNEAISLVADMAYKQKTGARGLMTVIEKILREFKYELPSTNVKNFIMDKEVVINSKKVLKLLINNGKENDRIKINSEINLFTKKFKTEYGFTLNFTEDAIKSFEKELTDSAEKNIMDICMEKFSEYPLGLNLVNNSLKDKVVDITRKMIKHPKEELSKLIAEILHNEQKN